MSGSQINAQIPLGVRPPEAPNILGMAQQATQLQSGINQNRLFAAQEAAGNDLRNAIDENGVFQRQAANRLLRNNPGASLAMGETLSRSQGLEGQQAQISAAQAQLGIMRLGNLSAAMAPLLNDPNLSREKIVGEMGRLLGLPDNQQPFSRDAAVSFLSGVPANADSAMLRTIIAQKMQQTQAGIAHLQNYLPRYDLVDVGGHIVPRQVNELAPGGQQFGAPVARTVSPGEMNAPLTGMDNAGRPIPVPRVAAAPMVGVGEPPIAGRPVAGGAAPVPGAAGRPPMPGAAGTAPRPPAGAQRGAEPPIVAPGTPPAAGGPQRSANGSIVTGLAPGSAEYQRTQAELAGRFVENTNNIDNMRSGLLEARRDLREFNSGRGAEAQTAVLNIINRNTPFTIDLEGVAAAERFGKLTQQVVHAVELLRMREHFRQLIQQ
jgi:hypothetical protein